MNNAENFKVMKSPEQLAAETIAAERKYYSGEFAIPGNVSLQQTADVGTLISEGGKSVQKALDRLYRFEQKLLNEVRTANVDFTGLDTARVTVKARKVQETSKFMRAAFWKVLDAEVSGSLKGSRLVYEINLNDYAI